MTLRSLVPLALMLAASLLFGSYFDDAVLGGLLGIVAPLPLLSAIFATSAAQRRPAYRR